MLNKFTEQFQNLSLEGSESVFIFQANRLLGVSEILEIDKMANEFIATWTAHESKIYAKCSFFFGQFMVFFVNEDKTSLSGCAKDKLTHFIQKCQSQLNIDLLNRQNLAFIKNNKIEIIPLSQIEYAIANQLLSIDTFYFNNIIHSAKELSEKWIIPLKESWLKRYI